jgi:hypothetical protein
MIPSHRRLRSSMPRGIRALTRVRKSSHLILCNLRVPWLPTLIVKWIASLIGNPFPVSHPAKLKGLRGRRSVPRHNTWTERCFSPGQLKIRIQWGQTIVKSSTGNKMMKKICLRWRPRNKLSAIAMLSKKIEVTVTNIKCQFWKRRQSTLSRTLSLFPREIINHRSTWR